MFIYYPKRSRNKDLVNSTKKAFLSSSSKEDWPIIWSEELYPKAQLRRMPNSDLNNIPNFSHDTFEQEIAAHFLTYPLNVKKLEQHAVWKSQGLSVSIFEGARQKTIDPKSWRPVVKILESPIYFEGRKYTSVMVQCFGIGFINEMIDNTPHNRLNSSRAIIRALRNVENPTIVLKNGKPITPVLKDCTCSTNKRYELPEPLPPKVTTGSNQFFLPGTVLKALLEDTTPYNIKGEQECRPLRDFVNPRKWLNADQAITDIYVKGSRNNNETLILHSNIANNGFITDFKECGLFRAMRTMNTPVHASITEKCPNKYSLDGFYRKNVVYLLVFEGLTDMLKWEDSSDDGFHLGKSEDQYCLKRFARHITDSKFVPAFLGLWFQTRGFNEHNAMELEAYLHQRLANHLAVEWGIDINNPISLRKGLKTIQESRKVGFKCTLKRLELRDLCIFWISEYHHSADWEALNDAEMLTGMLQIEDNMNRRHSDYTNGRQPIK